MLLSSGADTYLEPKKIQLDFHKFKLIYENPIGKNQMNTPNEKTQQNQKNTATGEDLLEICRNCNMQYPANHSARMAHIKTGCPTLWKYNCKNCNQKYKKSTEAMRCMKQHKICAPQKSPSVGAPSPELSPFRPPETRQATGAISRRDYILPSRKRPKQKPEKTMENLRRRWFDDGQPRLSDDDIAKCEGYLSSSDPIICKLESEINRVDIGTLNWHPPLQHLNINIVHFYMKLLMERSNKRKHCFSKLHVIF